jgi:2-hydroxy-3-keto-5-methylthiopentenyl-1-phosphate phosphatase
MNFSRVVFCDFDGTITTQDTFVRTCPPNAFGGLYRPVSVLEKFAPEAAAQFLPAIYRREITLKAGVDKTLGLIPAQDYPALIKFVADQPIRPGLKEFIDFLNNAAIPFVIISGGLTGMVKAVLERQQLLSSVTAIHAGEVATKGRFLQPYCQISSNTEFVAKVIAMNQYSAEEKVAIGDSVTDINMSLAADVVFARDREAWAEPNRLQQYLIEENKSYIPWQDFFEIRDYLAAKWQDREG